MLPNSKKTGIAAVAMLLLAQGAALPAWGHGPAADRGAAAPARTDPATRVLDLSTLTDMNSLIKKLADRQVVYVGETHDRYDHHLNQLAIIRGLHAHHPDLVIGLEFFQQPFQRQLDRYVAGEIDEKTFVRETEYFDRWRYDYRLYRPIFRFAREQGIPMIALNIPRELSRKVAREGMEGLSAEERARLPAEIDRDDPDYRRRIEAVFAQHPMAANMSFENFLAAQLLWDEGMAERAAAHFQVHPDGHMVVLAGAGHLVYGQGIPRRLERRAGVKGAVVINHEQHGLDQGVADFLLFPQRVDLPKSGLLGVFLDTDKDGVAIKGFSDPSPAEAAGMKEGDRILKVAGEPVQAYADIRLALMDSRPGEEVTVEVFRKNLFLGDERSSYRVKLQ